MVVVALVVCINDVVVVKSAVVDDSAGEFVFFSGVEGEEIIFVVFVSMLLEVGDVNTSPVVTLEEFQFMQVCTDILHLQRF